MTFRRPVPVAARLVALAGAVALGGVQRAGAQEVACDRGDTEVRGLDFDGNRAFSDAQLSRVVVTTPSSSVYRYRLLRATLRWAGQRRCIQRTELVLDRARLILFYRNRGFPDVAVDTAVTRDGRAIRVLFSIAEGRPIRVENVTINWLDTVPGAARIVRGLPVRQGASFDKVAVDAARDSIILRLGNAGYPWAQVTRNYETAFETYSARVTFDVVPGPRTRIGRVDVVAQQRPGSDEQQISDGVARKLTGLKPGALYRDRDIGAARRNLYLTEAYQSVNITRDSMPGMAGPDSLINLRVSLAEGFMRAASVSGGYGTIDCFRGQGDLTHRNVRVGGLATRMELTARVSKIGRGAPLGDSATGAKICPQITNGEDFDPYSDELNYYGGVTMRQPLLTGVPNVLPTITLFSQRASEYKAFLRYVPVGLVATYSFAPRRTLPQVVSYALERGSTTAAPAVFCAAFNACQEQDRAQLQQRITSGTLGYSITRNRANDPVNPNRGSVARVDLRHASALTLSDDAVRFSKAVMDVSWYLPGGGANVLALRMRGGTVFGSNLSFEARDIPGFVPQQERLFAGGAQTVRGFRQNELGPQVYVADAYDAIAAFDTTGARRTDPVTGLPLFYLRAPTSASGGLADTVGVRAVPTGGNTLVVTNVEYRLRPPFLSDLLQLVAFVDAGNVWDRRTGSDAIRLFATPGAGVRVASPFGPIRVDFGYNRHRPSEGAVFFEDVSTESRPLYCVTPGNEIPYVQEAEGGVTRYRQVGSASCPSSFRGERREGFRRFNITLSIAQAF
jgi:outer membrane protein assembly factor BamA